MKLAIAQSSHYDAVAAMLEAEGLITEDLDPTLAGFVVLLEDERVIAAGGVETLGGEEAACGLIRSVVVDPACRGRGLGRTVYERLERDARGRELTELYLLTETAEAFFSRLGFELLPRESAPAALKATAQFSGLCPASAAVMHKHL